MTRLSGWILWLVLMGLQYLVGGEFFLLSKPAVSGYSFYNQLIQKMYCVTDDINSALVWNHHLNWESPTYAPLIRTRQPVVIPSYTYVYPSKDDLTCLMSSYSNCSKHWNKSNFWFYTNTLETPTAAVFDKRWEDVQTDELTDRFGYMKSIPADGSLAFSIRGSNDVHFAICNGRTRNAENDFCFYIILGGWKNARSVIRKCETGIPNPATAIPEGACRIILADYKAPVLSTLEWKTFVLKWDFKTQIKIEVYDSERKILDYEEMHSNRNNDFTKYYMNTTHNTEYMLYARSPANILIKVHYFTYLMTKRTQSKLSSPAFMSTLPDSKICIEMSVSVCPYCFMTVDIIDSSGNTRSVGIINNSDNNGNRLNKQSKDLYNLKYWQHKKIEYFFTTHKTEPIRLEFNTFLINNTYRNMGYWAISNVHRCYDGALKYIEIDNYQDYTKEGYVWPNVTCQKILANGTSEIIGMNNHKKAPTENRLPCAEGHIGRSCLTRCYSLFPDHSDCHDLLACDNTGCSCAPGFQMPTCSNHCPYLSYGYDCNGKCGHCAHADCNIATGVCKSGCEDSNTNLYLQPYCVKGVGSLPPPLVEPINSTCVRVYLDVKEEYKLMPTIIYFEIWLWENTTKPFQTSDKVSIQTNDIAVSMYAEPLSPGTQYKAIGILEAGNKTFRGAWKDFTTDCTESPAINFVTIPVNESTIIMNLNREKHTNDSCPDAWYHVQVYTENNSIIYNGSVSFPKTFVRLEPFTEYTFLITSEKTNIILERNVRTLEGAPSSISNLQIIPTTMDKIALKWEPPEKTNGKILNYTVEIKPIVSIGCKDFNQPSYRLLNESSEKSFLIRSAVKADLQNSFTYTFNGLRPYTTYLVRIYASTSAHRGEPKEFNHTTDSLITPTEVFSNLRLTNESDTLIAGILRWSPPSNCLTITGPIKSSKVSITKSNVTLVDTEIENNFSLLLHKNTFVGAVTYEARICTQRRPGGATNQSACVIKNITIPAREPPPIQNLQIIEVDTTNNTTTLRWEMPKAPLNGKLNYYSIVFCARDKQSCLKSEIINLDEYCKLWNLQHMLCKTVSLPTINIFNQIQVRAFNKDVLNGSEPFITPVIWNELVPSAPTNLRLQPNNRQTSSLIAFWTHPLKSGGRLAQFQIRTTIVNTNLKHKPTEYLKQLIFEVWNYQPEYSAKLELLPSTKYVVSIQAITQGKTFGEMIDTTIELPSLVNFTVNDLKPQANDDTTTIDIRIPEIVHDVRDSIMLIEVQGSKHCDAAATKNESDDLYLAERQDSTYYKVSWIAAILKKPELYANKTFTIGDCVNYGGFQNYALCPKESYIIHLFLLENSKIYSDEKSKKLKTNILKYITTNPIQIGDYSKNYAMLLSPLFFIVLIAALTVFIIYRKKLTSPFITSQLKSDRQENMSLSNDLSKEKSNNSVTETEIDIKMKKINPTIEPKIIPNNNMFIVEKKKDFTMPVKIENFENYFISAYKSGALEEEYSSITNRQTKPWFYGSQPETKPKNRYQHLYPYDETRVILEKLPDDPYSDYINANFITGYGKKEKAYIATQGPKNNTVIDFWRMIWQENVQIICMITNLIENEKIKCEQYWPSAVGKKFLYGVILVEFSSEKIHSDYTYRTFKVSCGSLETRTVEHLHYTAWPDHGVPSNPRSLIAFLQELYRHAPLENRAEQPPIVVHCSAGVGRTGTLIVLDMCLHQAFSEKSIYVFENILKVRQERFYIVAQTQYLLVHLILVEYFHFKNTCFRCDKTLPENLEAAKKKSSHLYQRILDTSWYDEVLGSPPLPEKTLSNKNRAKHRFPETAAALNRLYLKRSIRTDEDSDYIAATCIRGIFQCSEYITTQLPLPTTLADFWRMLSEQNVEYVLVLQLPDLQNPTYCELVPDSQEFGSSKYLKIIRQQNSTIDLQYYFKEEVLIIDSSEQPSKEQIVKVISYKNWPECSLPSPNELVQLWKVFDRLPKQTKCPIVIACANGVTASSIWLASSFLLKRMTVDNMCDVPQAVQVIRRCRKDFLNQPIYLEYLYDVASAWSADI